MIAVGFEGNCCLEPGDRLIASTSESGNVGFTIETESGTVRTVVLDRERVDQLHTVLTIFLSITQPTQYVDEEEE